MNRQQATRTSRRKRSLSPRGQEAAEEHAARKERASKEYNYRKKLAAKAATGQRHVKPRTKQGGDDVVAEEEKQPAEESTAVKPLGIPDSDSSSSDESEDSQVAKVKASVQEARTNLAQRKQQTKSKKTTKKTQVANSDDDDSPEVDILESLPYKNVEQDNPTVQS